MAVFCTYCGRDYPLSGLPYKCSTCGGLFDIKGDQPFSGKLVDPCQPGIWRYRHTFGLSKGMTPVSIGEGNTPLVWMEAFGRRIAFKCEYCNPTGSFKDRGSSVITAWLQARKIKEVVEDSSGNAGASLAAYTALAGIKSKIFVPASASGRKIRQIETFGAEIQRVSGSRSDVTEKIQKVVERGAIYASHAYLPFNLPGYATAAYEIYEQLGNRMPAGVIVPAGQGGLLLGLARGFDNLRIADNNLIDIPKMIGVQTQACAPLWEKYSGNKIGSHERDMQSIAEGVQVNEPVRADMVLKAINESHGFVHVVQEGEIIIGRDALAQLGLFVEPTSAIVWSALEKNITHLKDPVVVLLTGSGYKN
jgi:threonine synthase